ncbi:21.7 kDa class VI heat shock protein isoform X2 [Cynara cardunculus var. scolymus]|uniref:Alpha crystallin/Hsp20 domain-containing protein n=1 Tax=Cynara cardunculus var. scolymus TaxID=59895 RepID=A0A118K6A8_CYNCS|nr:21.7 kDa class VI heat shock protein isoform X2 [Cynara cardunculus var. scolymus]KVI10353.1 Alpha crystallin/Hsp20 domain-containing protein [Cynara cardunculus var. scolymus]
MTNIQLEVLTSEDHQSPHKWCVPLKEDVFAAFMAKGGPIVHRVFGHKSLFGPLLFTKFFDPSDAFPLWEFEPAVLLSHLHNPCVDWFQTDASCILISQLPKIEKSSLGICVENGKVIEISGLWKKHGESRTTDWRSGKWWEDGFVRRLELPDNTDWKKMEVYVKNDTTVLDIRLPKLLQRNVEETRMSQHNA